MDHLTLDGGNVNERSNDFDLNAASLSGVAHRGWCRVHDGGCLLGGGTVKPNKVGLAFTNTCWEISHTLWSTVIYSISIRLTFNLKGPVYYMRENGILSNNRWCREALYLKSPLKSSLWLRLWEIVKKRFKWQLLRCGFKTSLTAPIPGPRFNWPALQVPLPLQSSGQRSAMTGGRWNSPLSFLTINVVSCLICVVQVCVTVAMADLVKSSTPANWILEKFIHSLIIDLLM